MLHFNRYVITCVRGLKKLVIKEQSYNEGSIYTITLFDIIPRNSNMLHVTCKMLRIKE